MGGGVGDGSEIRETPGKNGSVDRHDTYNPHSETIPTHPHNYSCIIIQLAL